MSSINTLGGSNAWASMSSQRTTRPPGAADAASFKQKMFERADADGSGGIDAGELQGLMDQIASKTGQTAASGDAATTFSKLDTNGDGSLGQAELDSGLKNLLPPPPDTMSFARSRGSSGNEGASRQDTRLLQQIDSDGNGSIDKSELAAVFKQAGDGIDVDAAFSLLDADGSGGISLDELAAPASADSASGPGTQGVGGPPPGPPPGGKAGGQGDSSSSSDATDPMDINGDGTVTQAERSAYMAQQAQQVVQNLFSAMDSDGDAQVSATEASDFAQRLASAFEGGSSSSNKRAGGTTDFQAMTEQVLRRYGQSLSANSGAGSLSEAA
jgi:Ca2+-binding EF-hand superfamily protein